MVTVGLLVYPPPALVRVSIRELVVDNAAVAAAPVPPPPANWTVGALVYAPALVTLTVPTANVGRSTAPVPTAVPVPITTPMVGEDVYPVPPLERVTPAMAPVVFKAAVAAAGVVLVPVMVTVGADVYPLPGFVTVIPVITPLAIVAVAVAPVPPPPEKVTAAVV
jgi:hypothetical protein